MNGVTDGYADWLYADGDYRPDDDPEHWIAGAVTPDCPICGRGLGWDGAVLFCENCETVQDSAASDTPFPASYDEWNAARAVAGLERGTFSEYLRSMPAPERAALTRRALIAFGAIDEDEEI